MKQWNSERVLLFAFMILRSYLLFVYIYIMYTVFKHTQNIYVVYYLNLPKLWVLSLIVYLILFCQGEGVNCDHSKLFREMPAWYLLYLLYQEVRMTLWTTNHMASDRLILMHLIKNIFSWMNPKKNLPKSVLKHLKFLSLLLGHFKMSLK